MRVIKKRFRIIALSEQGRYKQDSELNVFAQGDTMRTMMMSIVSIILAAGLLFFQPTAQAASEADRIVLPPPDKEGGMPLMKALALRKSTREFKDAPLTGQDLSNLLWAAWGVNRPDGRRTAPTARNTQSIEVYAAMENGVWRYEGEKHELVKVLDLDARDRFGGWPLTLLYAAEDGPFGGMHAGSLYQNAGLYCASAGLNNVVKATGAAALKKELNLPKGYNVLIIQSIGLPK